MMKRGVSTSMKQCENKSLGNPGPIEVITLSSGDEGTDSRSTRYYSRSARSHSYRRRRSVSTDRQRNSPAHRHNRSVSREIKRKIRAPSGSGSKSSSWSKSRRSVSTDRQRNSPAHRHNRSVSREIKRKIRAPSGSGSKSSSWSKSRRSVSTDRQRNSPAHRHNRSVSRERKRKIRAPSGSGSKSSSWSKSRRSVSTDRQRNSPAHRHNRSVSRERKRKIRAPSGSGSKSSSWSKSRRSVSTDRQRNSPAHRHNRSVSRERKRKIRAPSGSGSKSSSWSKSRSFGKRPYNTFHSRRNPRKASLSPVAENDYADTQVSSIYGRNIPFPITDFRQGHFKECIFETLKTLNYQKPTPIQAQGIPAILKGRDVVGIAQTGSGKTLTYILPAIVHVDQKCGYLKRNDGPTVLILAPTRELAQQIQSVCGKFTRRMNIKNIIITGGEKKGPQLQNLDGADICIATPGRLIDFLQSSDIILKNSTTLVIIDEADRLLDMGFMPQIIKILKQLRPDHQTLMFSATWPTDVKQIAEDFLQDYIQINIGTLKLAANHNITQIVDVVEECEKDDKLIELLKKLKNKSEKKIVFLNRRDRVDELTYHLKNNGYDAKGIHGKKSQKVRDQVLSEFRKGVFPILVATDVAARGLDVDDIKYVINVDFPNCSEDYIHRIGRTARLNKTGTAYTFFTLENINHAKFLVDVLQEANQTVNPKLLDLVEMPQSFNFRRGSPL